MLPAPIETEVLFEPFPRQGEFVLAALSGQYKFILYGGAIRGGKTLAMLALFILLCKIFPGSRWVIIRKDLPTIKQNLLPVWEKLKPSNFVKSHNRQTNVITFNNKSQLILFSESYKTDKEMLRFRGFEFNGAGFDEINECQQQTLGKVHERAGSYIVPGLKIQPPIIVVGSCNPTQGWVKTLIYNPWKEGTLKKSYTYIPSRISDNYPLLKANPAYLPGLKETMSVFEYEVFVNGNWDVVLKTGGEFLRNFEINKHVTPTSYDPDYPVHMSMDSNTYPYISFTFWQFIPERNGMIIRQIDEMCVEDPNNTAPRAGEMAVDYYNNLEGDDGRRYIEKISLFGDRSTKNRNNIDPEHRSFYTIVEQTLKNNRFRTWDRIWKAPPTVSSMGDFVNGIFENKVKGLRIEIGEQCKRSIVDYIASKTGKNGELLKVKEKHPTIEGLSYEKNGHLTDTLKDIICQAFSQEYKDYTARHKRLIPGGIITVARQDNITF